MKALTGITSALLIALLGCGPEAGPDAAPRHTCTQPEDPSPDALPEDLTATGLFCDGEYTDAAWPFEPRWPLWTDGLVKRRRALLPDGSPILSRENGSWDLPVGTRLSKTIFVDGEPVESRVSWKVSEGWLFGAYEWQDGEATLVPDGKVTEAGYEIPGSSDCISCHGAQPRPNAFNAWQLKDTETGLNLDLMIADGVLRGPGLATPVELPGDPAIAAAIGYLATNCGSCHSDRGIASALDMRLDLTWPIAQDLESTPFFQTTVGEPAQTEPDATRVVAGQPDASFLYQRMVAQDEMRMPPLGTRIHDVAGIALVEAAIAALQ